MSRYTVSQSAGIAAPAAKLYAILADYRRGHRAIAPLHTFPRLEVVEGGVGAGTVVDVEMRFLGSTHTARATITEPEPGRVLVETIPTEGIVTTFTVTPEGATGAEVTIATELPGRDDFLGEIEGSLARSALRRVYREELTRLADCAGARPVVRIERHAPPAYDHELVQRAEIRRREERRA